MQRGIFDAILVETHVSDLIRMWRGEKRVHHWEMYDKSQSIPAGVVDEVPLAIYDAYQQGRDSACGDMVVATQKPNGQYAVLLSKRNLNVCFGGKWWIHGSKLLSYASVMDFVAFRTIKECGVSVQAGAFLGVARTCANDHVGSTLQTCYAGRVPYEAIASKLVDDGHSDVRLFTLEEIRSIPEAEQHWYPLWAATHALASLKELV